MNITVGGWFLYAFILLIIIGIGTMIYSMADLYNNKIGKILLTIIIIAIGIGVMIGLNWYYGNTESGKRAVKTQESNFQQGIKRSVHVYDMNGGLIKTYEGKFDVDYDNDRVIFDDEKGLRHIIYYPTGTIIIDELP